MFAVFMVLTIFSNLVNQIMPHFVTQRALYEVRERPSKTYSWQAFMLANITAEIPWNALMAVLIFICWYYPIGLYHNAEATDAVTSRSGLVFLFVLSFLLFTSTFTNLVIAGIDTAETAGNVAALMFMLCLVFCGYVVSIFHFGSFLTLSSSVLASPDDFPRFWIFMYRVSPLTYLVNGILTTSLANSPAVCSAVEISTIQPPSNMTCGEYLAPYIASVGDGVVSNPAATADCQFCSITSTNSFLAAIGVNFDNRWRDYGLLWVYIIFNIFGALFLYWLARVPKGSKVKKE